MSDEKTRGAPASALYRAIWRWHFYAGLLVLPFLAILAVTGALYLFKDEINDRFYPETRFVAPQQGETLAPSALTAAALAAHPGVLRGYVPPAAPDRPALVRIAGADGVKDVVFVNPWDGTVLGTEWDAGFAGSRLMWVVRKLHSLDYVGWLGNRLIELAAGWSVLLVGTGLFLWWPRGRGLGVLVPRRTAGRPLWRDLHAVTGIWAGALILFLAMTGMPWSGVWGKQFYALSYDLGIGMPDGYWDKYPVSTVPVREAADKAPWIMENQPLPLSKTAEGVPASLDAVVARIDGLGLAPGWAVNIPTKPEGVYTASVYPDDVRLERVVHLDQYSGEVLFDLGFADLGALGMAAEWGISVHMGQEFGAANQIVMLLACLALLGICVSAAVMWWKRRPAGRIGAPTYARGWRASVGVLVIAVACGVFFPLVGLSLLVFAGIELALALRPARVRPA